MTREDIKHIVRAIKNYRQLNVSWFTKDDDFIAEQLETRFIDKPSLVITTSSAPEGLDKAAYKYSFESRPSVYGQVDVIDAFKAGAEWQKEQMGEQARKELAKTDITLADLVAFDEGCKLGRRLERQDMLKEAVEGVMIDSLGVRIMAPLNAVIQREGLKDGDKVKIVIVKEDEK